MAEYLLRERLGTDTEWQVSSAGVCAVDGLPASTAAVDAMRESGIDMDAHRSRPLSRELADSADVIVVMTTPHGEHVRLLAPGSAEKVVPLGLFDPDADGDVEDPIGLSPQVYRDVRSRIERAMPNLLSFLAMYKKKGSV
jgi:protein-tyrosine-phosphatase